MLWNDYEFSDFTSDDIPGILKLLTVLWGNNEASNIEYFNWKHQQSPYPKKTLGVVVKYGGKIIGFWGFLPTEWEIKGEKVYMLNACDVVIDPEHRGKGLYYQMMKYIMNEHCHEYRYLISFTANNMSTSAATKAGWEAFLQRHYLRHFSLIPLLQTKMRLAKERVLKTGIFSDIEVSYAARPFDISRIDSRSAHRKSRLSQNKTPDYIKWKASDYRLKPAFFYHLKESRIDAYLILSLRGMSTYVLDFGEEEGSDGIKHIINYIIARCKFASISWLSTDIPQDLQSFLKTKFFGAYDYFEKIKKGRTFGLPIVIRPMVDNYKEDDWYIGDVDVRKADNWHISEICFD
jgi:GNAT superfamily N-acetyltransferase